jgi:ABC-type dipeptide/oligopeptide/nickel transport system permease subunit
MNSASAHTTAASAASQASAISVPRGFWYTTWRRLWRSSSGRIGVVMVAIVLLITFVPPIVDPYDASIDSDLSSRLQGPSAQHLFGTDKLGRDIFRRLTHGALTSMSVALIVIVISTVGSTTIGMVAGYFGGYADSFFLRLAELMNAFPAIPLAIALVAIQGPGLLSTVMAITIVGIPGGMRVSRALTLSLRSRLYVESAIALGVGNRSILLRHILPHLLAYIIVGVTMGIGGTILTASALGFLGLGAQPPTPEWGVMISEGAPFLTTHPHAVLFPGLMIAFTVLAFNLFGDGLRDALDPSLHGGT